MSLIEIQDIAFEYGKDARVLDGIDLSIEKGTMTTILGLNGCGKTTMIKLIAGLMKPSRGEILIDEISVLSMSDHDRSRHIAYVPQFAMSRIHFKTEDYLALSLANQKSPTWEPNDEDKIKVKEYAQKMNIDENKLNRRVDELSGGERQIVMICGALLQKADIIVLDEPTASLDLKNQHLVLKTLKTLKNSEESKTVILSTHDPNQSLMLGGDVVVLHEKKVFLKGDGRTEIIKADKLKEVYGENIIDSKKGIYDYIVLND